MLTIKSHHQERWERHFQRLKDELASESKVKNSFLKKWILRQRTEFQRRKQGCRSALTDDRLSKLQTLENEYGIFKFRENPWGSKFKELVDFIEKHNGLFPFEIEEEHMTKEIKLLEEWCTKQRNFYHTSQKGGRSRQTEARIKKLDGIGFPWNVNDAKWTQRYLELVEYYKVHGDSLVPNYYAGNRCLARWVKFQRHNTATPERKELLDKVEFIWDPYEYRWMLKYNELKEYMVLHGAGSLPSRRARGHVSLARWIRYQKSCYRKFLSGEASSMTEHRKQLLEKLGLNIGEAKH